LITSNAFIIVTASISNSVTVPRMRWRGCIMVLNLFVCDNRVSSLQNVYRQYRMPRTDCQESLLMKVSIVTPSYNQGQFIERTLLSVANQSGAEIEHVVFDGGSTDETVDVLKEFSPPVRWVSKKDKGQTDALNQGIQETDGDIIGWLNSDDTYYPGAIARVVEFFAANPDVDVMYGLADYTDVDDHPFDEYPTEPWDFERLKDTCFICQPALFFRRRVVDEFGLFDDSLNYCMDYEYWLRLGKGGVKFAFLDEKLATSRLYAENKTMSAKVKVCTEINNVFIRHFGKVPDRWLIKYAFAVVTQGATDQNNSGFTKVKAAIYTIVSALRWNKCISFAMIGNLFSKLIQAVIPLGNKVAPSDKVTSKYEDRL